MGSPCSRETGIGLPNGGREVEEQTDRMDERKRSPSQSKGGFFTLLQRKAVFLTVLVEMICT